MKCKRNSQHLFDDSLKNCPWCARTTILNGNDPFPSVEAVRKGEHRTITRVTQKVQTAVAPTKVVVPTPLRTSTPPPAPVASKSNGSIRVSRSTPYSSSPKNLQSYSGLGELTSNKMIVVGLGLIANIYLYNASKGPSLSRSPASRNATFSAVPAPVVRMLPPAQRWVKTPVQGLWRGTFSKDKATIHIRSRRDNEFWGILTVLKSQGNIRLDIHGTLPGNGIVTMRESRLRSQYRGANWALGVNAGRFSSDERTMSGIGKDIRQSTYQWSFTRVAR